jgi:hypothetical protein
MNQKRLADRLVGLGLILVVIIFCSLLSVLTAQAPDTNKSSIPSLIPSLSELSQLKAENFKLKIQLSQCQVDLLSFKSSTDLSLLQQNLEASFRKELKCSVTDKFNWATLKCEIPDVKKDLK